MISREQALKAIAEIDPLGCSAKEKGIRNGTRARIEADGREQYFTLRRQWSIWIIGWITSLIMFNILLTFLVGHGQMNFEHMRWFVSAVTVETFLQIVGLGYIAVKFLFSHR